MRKHEVRKVNQKPVFRSLAPTDKADGIGIYKEALYQALNNKDVYNIAITGAYGAGKSSILRTFFKEQSRFWPIRFKKNKVITISLAELASKDDISAGVIPAANITRQEIELSIIHQLFFHEPAGSLTDSHFTKIQRFGWCKLTRYTGYTMLFLVACIHVLYPGMISHFLGLPTFEFLKIWNWWHWLCVAVVLTGIAGIIAHIVRIATHIAVRKLSVDAAGIEIANTKEKSILNAHIDEIIYFFSATGHDVVVIEDLDRFKQPSIFVKLREINNLINNSKEVKKQVRFIYAISDSMFNDKTRTKFFDFIIPIIPMVDASNAGDMLHKLVPEHLGDVVDAVALYLNDARLLNNIANEFYIYRNKQGSLNQKDDEKILALVVYKNLFPSDFEDLRTQKKGLLACALCQRKKLADALIATKDARILELKAQIDIAKQEELRDVKELRQLMIAAVMQGAMENSTNGYICRQINCDDEPFLISELEKEEKFEKFRKAKSYSYYAGYHHHPLGVPYETLAKTVYGDIPYEERVKRIQVKVDDTALKEEERKLNEEKAQIKEQTIQQLLQSKLLTIDWGKYGNDEAVKIQREFIYDMLYGGYIDENYTDYISFFHEGSLSKEDYQFIRGVRVKDQTLEMYVDLFNVEKVIEKLDLGNFDQVEVLNFSLVDTLMRAHMDSDKCAHVINRIKKYDYHSIVFLAMYVEDRHSSGILIKQLCADKDNLLWSAIIRSNLPDFEKIFIVQSIIENGEEADVLRNLKGSEAFLAARADYFTWPISDERLKTIAKGLNLQFESLADETSSDFMQFVYNEGLYAITSKMLRRLLPVPLWDDENFIKANYTYLHDSDLSLMLKHVSEHMEDYVSNVLIPHTNKIEEADEETKYILWWESILEDEPEHVYEILLHDREINGEDMQRLIKNERKKWKSVEAYGPISDEVKIWLYKYQKVELTWENVLYLYKLDEEAFAEYICKSEVAFKLSQIEKPDFDEEGRAVWEQMQYKLLSDRRYKDVAEELIWCFDKEFDASVIKHCDATLLERLIELGRIKRGKEEYQLLNDLAPSLSLTFFIHNYENFAPMMDDMKFEDHDIEAMLRLKDKLTTDQKLDVLNHVKPETAVGMRSVVTISDFLLQLEHDKQRMLGNGVRNIIKAVLTYPKLATPTRLKLFNKYPLSDHTEIDQVISLLDRQYVDERGKLYNHLKPITSEMLRFTKYLERIRYLSVCKNYGWSKGYISIKY